MGFLQVAVSEVWMWPSITREADRVPGRWSARGAAASAHHTPRRAETLAKLRLAAQDSTSRPHPICSPPLAAGHPGQALRGVHRTGQRKQQAQHHAAHPQSRL